MGDTKSIRPGKTASKPLGVVVNISEWCIVGQAHLSSSKEGMT